MTPHATALEPMHPLAILRRVIATEKPRKLIPDLKLKQPLTRGWLLPCLLGTDELIWGRWQHWFETMEAGRLLDKPIPQIEWSEGSSPGRKMVERSLDAVTRYGGWQGWSGHSHFDFFLDWLLFALGDQSQKELPKEGSDQAGAVERLYQVFNLETMLAYPYDYFGDILAESGYGRHQGFFPTPLHVCELMTRMQMGEDEDMRAKTVCDPALGTGRMLMCASNHSFRLYGNDINLTVIKACKVNFWLYAPWGAKPFPFLEKYESAEPDAAPVPHFTQRIPEYDPKGQSIMELV